MGITALAKQCHQRLSGRKISGTVSTSTGAEGSYLLLRPPKDYNKEAAEVQTP